MYSLPAGRAVTWQGNVGVSGDIPAQTQTIYTTLSPSGGDDNAAIQTALTNCPSGQVVALSAGTFKINGVIKIPTGKVLRGAGMGQTILQVQSTITGTYVIGFYATGTSWNLSLNTAYDLTGTMSKGTTTIQTQNAHNWAVNDIIVIDQLNNDADDPPVTNTGVNGAATFTGRANGGRSLGQVCKVTAVPDTTHATLEIPLYWDYDNTLTPQAVEMPGLTQNAGIEDLTLDNSLNPLTSQNDGPLAFMAAINCWAYRVEVIGSYKQSIRMYQAYRCTVRGCKIHEGIPATPIDGAAYGVNRGYGIYVNPWASACLIEHNVFYHLSSGVIMNGPVSGNAIAYNRFSDLYYTDTAWVREAVSMHGAHPVMNLIEGNWSTHWLTADFYWGSSSHNTFFRNRVAMDTSKTSGTWDVGIYHKNRYYNIVNNIIGTTSHEDTYEVNGTTFSVSNGPKLAYMLGYYSANGSITNHDTAVASTMIRHANWDSVNAGVVWGDTDHTIANSLYLAAKPAWMGSGVNWPPVGNEVTPMFPALDADPTINPFDAASSAVNSTVVGTATAVAGGTSSINVSLPYTEDDNSNNTYTVDYKLSSEPTTWTNWVTAATHTASPYTTTITGLAAGTSYDVRVTYNDADGVTGTNPQTITGVSTDAEPAPPPDPSTYFSSKVKANTYPRAGIGFDSNSVDYEITAALVEGDVIQMLLVAKGTTILDVILAVDDLDTGETPALTLDVGDDTVADRYIAASTVGQGGGVVHMDQPQGAGYTYTDEGAICVKVKAAPATGAVTGKIRLIIIYTMDK